jgi:hypothetical protein
MVIDSVVGRVNSCYVEYWAPTRTIFLKTDNNASWITAVLGANTALTNSQCSVNALASSITGSTLKLAISFGAHYQGVKPLLTFISDNTGKTSGWVNSGTFTSQ